MGRVPALETVRVVVRLRRGRPRRVCPDGHAGSVREPHRPPRGRFRIALAGAHPRTGDLLRIGPLGRGGRDTQERTAGRPGGDARPLPPPLPAARWTRTRHGLRADPFRQGRRPGGSDPAGVDRIDRRARHQGGKLEADRRLARPFLPLPVLQSDRLPVGPLQPAARGPPGTFRSSRCPEHRRHPGRSGRGAGPPHALGEDRPRPAGRRHPARVVRGAGKDPGKGGGRPVGSVLHLRTDARPHDAHAAPGRRCAPSGGGAGGPRAPQQVRQRALGGPVNRDELSGALPRPGRRPRHRGLRLAHFRPDACPLPGFAVPRGPAVGPVPHQTPDPAPAQPDRPPADRTTRGRKPSASPAPTAPDA